MEHQPGPSPMSPQQPGPSPMSPHQARDLMPPIAVLRARQRSGETTSECVVRDCLERIEARNPLLRALITVAADALDQARECDRLASHPGCRERPLHGIPIVLKDNIETGDMPTTAGAALLADHWPARDAPIARRLRQAGAVILGKANLHEFSYGLSTESTVGGQTRNPYDPAHHAGGSSGGSAVAVATGMAAAAIGTDTGGSVRFPAAHTGTFGLRPTAGLLESAGIVPLSALMDTAGPITRHAADLAPMLAVLTGRPVEGPRLRSVADLRIGVLSELFGRGADDSGVTSVAEAFIYDASRRGARVRELTGVSFRAADGDTAPYEFEETLGGYLASADPALPEQARTVRGLLDSGTLLPGVAERFRSALAFSGRPEEFAVIRARRREIGVRVAEFLDEHDLDLLAYPTFRSTAPLVGEEHWERSNALLASVTGMPALNMPVGVAEDGLPVGLELLARRDAESLLIEAAVLLDTHHLH